VTSVVPAREAATLMVVRDGDDGLEVLMVRRSLAASFVGGAFVFPGGAVDPADGLADLEAVSVGRTDVDASSRLGLDSGGLAYWVAALRECFEETGVLLARHEDGAPLDFETAGNNARFAEHRAAIIDGRLSLPELCRSEGLRLDLGAIHYFAHWITPTASPRRFDTRFFLALAPPGQEPLHNPGELIDQVWIRPEDAVEGHRQGTFETILPTVRNLEHISGFERAAKLVDAAAALRAVPTVIPRVVPGDRGRHLRLVEEVEETV
jgi:8-oxo-dGTP pyrophosphatase MutT (NUDIX family)